MAKNLKNPKLKILYHAMINCNKCSELRKMSCNIYDKKGNGPLPGGGDSLNCKIMFVGQNPSYRRFKNTTCAFSGGFGDEFRKILDDVGINKNIFITNVVKCSTPNNSFPNKEIINNCKKFLEEEIKIVNPKLIVPMGRCSIEYFNGRIGELTVYNNYKVFSIFHPNYVLSYKKDKMKDFIKMLEKIYKIAYLNEKVY